MSPAPFEQVRHRRDARISGKVDRQLVESPVGLLAGERVPRLTRSGHVHGDDGGGRLAVAEDERRCFRSVSSFPSSHPTVRPIPKNSWPMDGESDGGAGLSL
jgi:hypothetical protein